MLTGLGDLMKDTDERPSGVDFVVGKPVGGAVVRNRTLRQFYDPTVAALQTGDQVIVVRPADRN